MATKREFKVVVNHEEQYSIWPADRENLKGYKDEGTVGDQEECEGRIKQLTKKG